MNTYNIQKINYTKADGTTSEREVVIMSKPSFNVMAIDLTEVSHEQRQIIQSTLLRHAEELRHHAVAWKALKPDSIVYL